MIIGVSSTSTKKTKDVTAAFDHIKQLSPNESRQLIFEDNYPRLDQLDNPT
jgi:hypothetical protein